MPVLLIRLCFLLELHRGKINKKSLYPQIKDVPNKLTLCKLSLFFVHCMIIRLVMWRVFRNFASVMVLNYIWIAFFVIAFAIACIRLCMGDVTIFQRIVDSTFDTSKTAFETSLGLTGVLALWLGIMKIGEKAGAVNALARVLSPVFTKLFPDIPKNHPAMGSIFMNIASNMLGLDNAATPTGLKAMQQLQELNPKKDTATNPMIMFLVMNTSGLTIIPTTILAFRASYGAAQPTDVFIPILLATTVATLCGIILTAIWSRINIFQPSMIAILFGLCAFVGVIIAVFSQMDRDTMGTVTGVAGNLILLSVIVAFIVAGMVKKINVYDAFIEGAKEGFTTAVRIIPYLVAILVAVGVFRASGAMDMLINGIAWVVKQCGLNTDFVGALPTAFMKPLSGSGARGMMLEAMKTYGPDSFVGRLSCIMQGSTDTTFYILAVYFGSVNIKYTRHAVGCGLAADAIGTVAAILIAYIFFGN
jgi:spore maturation protein SpmA